MIKWDYDRHVILTDGIVHALGVGGGLVAVIVLLALAAPMIGPCELTSVAIYGLSLFPGRFFTSIYGLHLRERP